MPETAFRPLARDETTNRTLHSRLLDIVFEEVRWTKGDAFSYETVPVSAGKWVYLLVTGRDGHRTVEELAFDAAGSFRQVDWSASDWSGQDAREPTRGPSTNVAKTRCLRLSVAESTESIQFFLSDVQLTRARLDLYVGNVEGCLSLRAFTVPYENLLRDVDDHEENNEMAGYSTHHWSTARKAVVVALPDVLGIAQKVHVLGYMPAVDAHARFLAQTDVSHLHAATTSQVAQSYEQGAQASAWQRNLLRPIEMAAEWTAQLVTEKPPDATVWDWIDRERLSAELRTWSAQSRRLRNEVDVYGTLLYATWMRHAAYEQAAFDVVAASRERGGLDDDLIDELVAQSELLRNASHSSSGRQHLDLLFGQHTEADGEIGISARGEPSWHDLLFFRVRDTVRRACAVVADQLVDPDITLRGKIDVTNQSLGSAESRLARVWDSYREALTASVAQARSATSALYSVEAEVARWQKLDRIFRGATQALAPAAAGTAAGAVGGTAAERALHYFKRSVRRAGAATVDAVRRWGIEPDLTRAQSSAAGYAGELDEMNARLRRLHAAAATEEAARTSERNALNREWQSLSRKQAVVRGRRLGAASIAAGLHATNLMLAIDQWRETRRSHPDEFTAEEAREIIGFANAVTESSAVFRHFFAAPKGTSFWFDFFTKVGVLASVLEAVYFGVSAGLAFRDDDTGRATGHLVSLAGAVWLVFTPSGWAVALLIAGQVVATAWGDDELEQWFKHCQWAKGRFSRRGSLSDQLDRLFAILLRPRVYLDFLDENGAIAEAPSALDPRRYYGPATLVLVIEPRLFDPGLMTLEVERLAIPSHGRAAFDAVRLVPQVLAPDVPVPARPPAPRPAPLGGPLRVPPVPPDTVPALPRAPSGPFGLPILLDPRGSQDSTYYPLYPAPVPREDYDLASDGTISRFEWRWDLSRMDPLARRMLADKLLERSVFAQAELTLAIQTRSVGTYQSGFRLTYRGLPGYVGPPPSEQEKLAGRGRHRPPGGEIGVVESASLTRRRLGGP